MDREFLSYEEYRENLYEKKLNRTLESLPVFCRDFFCDSSDMTILTKESYARDISLFFKFLEINESTIFLETEKDLERITSEIVESYKKYLQCYQKDGKIIKNSEKGIQRKFYSLKAFLAYYYWNGKILQVPDCLEIKEIKRNYKTKEEIVNENLLNIAMDEVYSSENLVGKQLLYANKTRNRDIAIISLLCKVGISLSSCVGLNCEDVDLVNGILNIRYKNQNTKVILDKQTVKELMYYLKERENIPIDSKGGNALFLSLQKKRMTGRAIEKMVKKYSGSKANPTTYRMARKSLDKK